MISLDVGCRFLDETQRPELELDVSLDLNLDKYLYIFGEKMYKHFKIAICDKNIMTIPKLFYNMRTDNLRDIMWIV